MPDSGAAAQARSTRGGLRGVAAAATAGAASTAALSKEARALLNVGRTHSTYIHDKRAHEDEGEDVPGAAGGAGAGNYIAMTFVESLLLPPKSLEDVAAGNFVYLRPLQDPMVRNMYDLQASTHEECDPHDYFTLSASGVTHFVGVASSDFVSLPQFEREFRLFHSIMRIPFFRKYRAWKAFTQWKKGISGRKMRNASQSLVDELFLLNPTLKSTLMRLRTLCAEVADYGLFNVDKTKTYSLEDFMLAQNEKRVSVLAWLNDFATEVRSLVRAACDNVLDAFVTANNIQASQKMTFMERSALRTACRRLAKFVRLADFLVRDALAGLALESVNALRNFICPPPSLVPPRLVRTELPVEGLDPEQQAAAEAAAKAAEQEALKMAAAGVDASKKKKGANLDNIFIPVPLFTISASFEDAAALARRGLRGAGRRRSIAAAPAPAPAGQEEKKGEEGEAAAVEAPVPELALLLTPSLPGVKSSLRGMLYDAMVVISAPPRLLTHPDLAAYMQAAEEEGGGDGGNAEVDLTDLVQATPAYKRMVAELFSGLESAFGTVDDFCSVFLPFGRTYAKNEAQMQGLDPSKYSGSMELSAFEKSIDLYRGQIAEFDLCPTSSDIGIVHINSIELKKKLIPSPTACLEAIRNLLPGLMTNLSTELTDTVRTSFNIVSGTPTEVDTFVAKVECLEQSQEQLPAWRDKEQYIRALATLMAENSWPLNDDLKSQFKLLRDALTDLETSAERAGAQLEQDTQKFAKQVEQSIPPFKRNVQAVREKMDDPMIAAADSDPVKVVKFVREQAARMEDLKNQGQTIIKQQRTLKQNEAEFELVDEVAADLQLKLKLWEAFLEFGDKTRAWKEMPFNLIDPDELGKVVQGYLKTAARSEKMLPGNQAAGKLKGLVEDFKALLPVVQDLRNKALLPRHWDDIQRVIGCVIDPAKVYTLGELLGMNVVENQPAIAVISTKAVQEAALDELFAKKVTSVWTTMEFQLQSYKDSKEVFVLIGVDEVIAALDESLVNLNTILGSRYAAPIRGEVEGYQKKLMLVSETLDEWITCQKQWMYLETIFSAEDIKRQLPEESKKFLSVDRSWKQIMKRTYNNPNCIAAGAIKGLKETLARHNEVLEGIQKSLEEYLETKRGAFPRFYFLSNEELLEILAQTRDPQAVQPHLRKCFDALVQLEFGKEPGSIDILAMISPEKERVELTKNLKARGNVEDWLMEVQKAMAVSLNRVLKEGVIDYARRQRKDWVLAHAAQIVATGAQIMWSKGTEEALRNANPVAAMGRWYDTNVLQLQDLTALVRGKLTRLERGTIVALVTTDVHARDIVETLRDEKIDSTANFTWQQQLRYYWEEAKSDCIVRQANASLGYGYEYMGATTRLVITPLTDRCWMTITGAYNLRLGAAPAGPAGTGKTESSKDLAKALAIQCIVFNCE